MMRPFFSFLLVLTLCFGIASAQQDPQNTMYMFNRFVVNPAYAGTLQATELTLSGRMQWVGIPGAPNSATASIQGYSEKLRGGLGGYLIADELGPISTVGLKGAYAFHLNIKDKARLNIGLAAGMYHKTLRGDWVSNPHNGSDPVPYSGNSTTILPDVDIGLYFHVPLKNAGLPHLREAFYAGVGVDHLTEPSLAPMIVSPVATEAILARQLHAMAGYTIRLSPKLYLQPSVFFRKTRQVMQLDINTNLFLGRWVGGLSHRLKDSFSAMIGFRPWSRWFFAYAYDHTISGLGAFTTGSHELVFSHNFGQRMRN